MQVSSSPQYISWWGQVRMWEYLLQQGYLTGDCVSWEFQGKKGETTKKYSHRPDHGDTDKEQTLAVLLMDGLLRSHRHHSQWDQHEAGMVCVPKKQLLGDTNGNEEPWKSGGEEQVTKQEQNFARINLPTCNTKAFRLGLGLPEGKLWLQIDRI